jgi:hypothetical protein
MKIFIILGIIGGGLLLLWLFTTDVERELDDDFYDKPAK